MWGCLCQIEAFVYRGCIFDESGSTDSCWLDYRRDLAASCTRTFSRSPSIYLWNFRCRVKDLYLGHFFVLYIYWTIYGYVLIINFWEAWCTVQQFFTLKTHGWHYSLQFYLCSSLFLQHFFVDALWVLDIAKTKQGSRLVENFLWICYQWL